MIFNSSFEYSYLWLPFAGFITGAIGSLVGGGGGFVFIPLLTILFNVPAHIAVATSLAATLPICIAGSIGHYRNNNVDVSTGLIFAFAGIFGALCGAGLTSIMSSSQLKTSFGIYSILIAIQIFIKNIKSGRSGIGMPEIPRRHNEKIKGSFFGFFAGVITGVFGTSGSAPIMAGLFSLDMPLKLVIGTSLLIVSVNTFSALTAHFFVGEIDLTIVGFITAGTIAGAFAGAKMLAGVKIGSAESPIRHVYALVIVLGGILMIIT